MFMAKIRAREPGYIHFALVGHLLGGTKAATITLAMIKLVLTPGGEQR